MSNYTGLCPSCRKDAGFSMEVDSKTGICPVCGWIFEQDMKDNPQNYTATGEKPLVHTHKIAMLEFLNELEEFTDRVLTQYSREDLKKAIEALRKSYDQWFTPPMPPMPLNKSLKFITGNPTPTNEPHNP